MAVSTMQTWCDAVHRRRNTTNLSQQFGALNKNRNNEGEIK